MWDIDSKLPITKLDKDFYIVLRRFNDKWLSWNDDVGIPHLFKTYKEAAAALLELEWEDIKIEKVSIHVS